MEYYYDKSETSNFSRYLSKFTQLESFWLTLQNQNTKILDLSFLSSFSQLINLLLRNVQFNMQDILGLIQVKVLEIELHKNITKDYLHLTNINYQNYQPFMNLENFSIDSIHLNYDFMQYLFQSKQLTSLEIFNPIYIPSSLYNIHQLTCLTKLTIDNYNCDQELFENICQLSQLQDLSILLEPKRLRNQSKKRLSFSKLTKQLQILSIECCYYPIFDEKYMIQEISQLTSLIDLTIYWFSNTFKKLKPLSKLTQLTHLSIIKNNERIRDEDKCIVNEILQLPNLTIDSERKH